MSDLSEALHAQRIELAGDVHDRIIPPLFAARMRLETLTARLQRAADSADAPSGFTEPAILELQQAAELIDLAIAKSRQLLQGLAPHEPGETHWQAQLQQALGDQGRELRQIGSLPWERIDPNAAVLLTSIAEEAIRNAVRHGGARQIEVRVAPASEPQDDSAAANADQLYELTIQDDGQGFDTQQPSDHHGLHLMRLRAAALDGQLTLSSQPGGPTRVILKWPVPVARSSGTGSAVS